jgi:hypothetical protein
MKKASLTVTAHALLQLLDLSQSRVLPAGTQQVAELVEGNTARAADVEKGESLLVVGRSLSKIRKIRGQQMRCGPAGSAVAGTWPSAWGLRHSNDAVGKDSPF